MINSNATPLIAFARIGQMSLFQKVVGSVVIQKLWPVRFQSMPKTDRA